MTRRLLALTSLLKFSLVAGASDAMLMTARLAAERASVLVGPPDERPRLSLLQLAAAAVSAGLPADAALAAVTIQPARILGIADRIGSMNLARTRTLCSSTAIRARMRLE